MGIHWIWCFLSWNVIHTISKKCETKNGVQSTTSQIPKTMNALNYILLHTYDEMIFILSNEKYNIKNDFQPRD
jgi:hypothetical protein